MARTTEKSLQQRLTHISVFLVLFRSMPNNLAVMKCSLKAGMSFTVAKHPSTDKHRLIRSGSTGNWDIFTSNEKTYFVEERLKTGKGAWSNW